MGSKKIGLALGLAALVVLAIIGLIALAKPTPQVPPTTAVTPQNTQPTQVKQTDQPAQNETGPRTITIINSSFQPATITIKKGTTVTWTDQDGVAHTVTTDNKSAVAAPNSPTLNQGNQYSFKFDTVGTFAYHCNFHSDMHGTVIVTE